MLLFEFLNRRCLQNLTRKRLLCRVISTTPKNAFPKDASPKNAPPKNESSDPHALELHHMQHTTSKGKTKLGHKKRVRNFTNLDHNCNLPFVDDPPLLRLSNIICTIGPASRDMNVLVEMMEAGMRIARMNFSHGTHEYHKETIDHVREAQECFSKKVGFEVPIAIALDTKGPEIRTGLINGSDKETVNLEKGATIKLTTNDEYKDKCNAEILYVDYKNLGKIVKENNKIYVDDGLLSLVVKSVSESEVVCEVENGGSLGSKKGVNLPGTPVDLPAVSEKDKQDLQFGVEQDVDVIFASFIRDGKAIEEIRGVLGEKGKDIWIIAKIENQQGLDNINEIISASDGIMVARGDLGIEIEPERVFLAQKAILARCNRVGKTAICATQMLESMTTKPRSTRAEAGDVANAIIDGADCVMLSGETAKGKYPVEAVKTMANICRYAEGCIFYSRTYQELVRNAKVKNKYDDPDIQSIAIGTAAVAKSLRSPGIIIVECDGSYSRAVARYRPCAPILAIIRDRKRARQLYMHRAIYPYYLKEEVKDPRELVMKVLNEVKQMLIFHENDKLVTLYETNFNEKQSAVIKVTSFC